MSSALILWMLGLAVLALAAGVAYQSLGRSADARRFPPPGQLIDIGHGRRLHLRCLGAGAPSVIFEAGIAASSLSWTRAAARGCVLPAPVATTVRAWRGAALQPDPSPLQAARELDELLRALRFPALRSGRAFGGAFVLRMRGPTSSMSPGSCWSIRSTRPVADDDAPGSMADRRRCVPVTSRRGALNGGHRPRLPYARPRIDRSAAPGIASLRFRSSQSTQSARRRSAKLPAETWPAVQTHWSQAKCFSSMAEHLAGLKQSAAEVEACGELPSEIPVVILTAATQSPAYRQEHARMVARSAFGRHILAAGSGHWIHLDEPELVVEAIRSIVADRRGAPRLA